MRHNYKFNQKILDKESDPRYIQKGKLIDARNCRVTDAGTIESLMGTEGVGSILPSGHTCIGAKKQGDWIYYFSTNNTVDNIARYNVVTSMNEPLGLSNSSLNFNTSNPIDFIDFLDDSENGRLLMFWTDGNNVPRYYDWSNPPSFSFDEDFFSVAKSQPFKSPDIRMVTSTPDSSVFDSGFKGENDLEKVMYRFAYRYIFTDGSTSALSSYSRTAFYHNHGVRYDDDTNANILRNYFSSVEVTVFLNSSIENLSNTIDKIEVYAVDLNLDTTYLINTIDHDQASVEYKFDFNNNSTYTILSSAESGKLFDNVPLVAKSQILAEDRIMYGRYTDGLDNDITPDWRVRIAQDVEFDFINDSILFSPVGGNIEIDNASIGQIYKSDIVYLNMVVSDTTTSVLIGNLDIMMVAEEDYATFSDFVFSSISRMEELFNSKGFSVVNNDPITTISNVSPTRQFLGTNAYVIKGHAHISLRKGTIYDYALAYFDKFGRSGALIEQTNIVSNRFYDNIGQIYRPSRYAYVEIGHLAPTWAEKFKLYRREKKFSTAILDTPQAETLAGEIYLRIPDDQNVAIPDESKFIDLIGLDNNYTVIGPRNKYTNRDRVFADIKRIEVTDGSHALGIVGRWIVIDDQFAEGFTSADIIATTDEYNRAFFEVNILNETQDEAYKEIPGDYTIDENRYHLLDFNNGRFVETSQSAEVTPGQAGAFQKNLCYDGDVIYNIFKNFASVMSYTDDGKMYSQLGRPQIASELRQLERKFSVIYSEEYNYETGFNGLSSFNSALINFKDYPREYGPVISMYYRDTNIIIFQEDKVILQPYNKNILESVGGGQTLTSGGGVLGVETAYAGEYGMSNPESLSFRGNILFWADSKRGVIMRLSQDGIYPISKLGMRDYFRDKLISARSSSYRLQGHYDWFWDEYAIHFPNVGVWYFSPDDTGWTHSVNYTPDRILNDGLNVYSFKTEDLYIHNRVVFGEYNIFYGIALGLSYEIAINEAFSDIKTLHALWIEGDQADVKIVSQVGDESNISYEKLEFKEDGWYSYIPMNQTTGDVTNKKGLGSVVASAGSIPNITITIGANFKTPMLGDIIKGAPSSSQGEFVSASGNDMVLQNATGSFVGDFAYIERNASVSGDNMRGLYFTLIASWDETNDKKKYFAINIEAAKSNV